MADEKPPLLIFLHIPKTGGSSLKTVFKAIYGPRLRMLQLGTPKDNLEALKRILSEDPYKYDVIGGHLSNYGIHEFTDRPVQYFAMMRNPGQRAISQYYHILRNKNKHNNRYQKIGATDNILDALPRLDRNQQTRVISGIGSGNIPTAEDLDSAKQHITEHFVTVGTLERIDETIMLLKQLMGWSRLILTPHRNPGRNRPNMLSSEIYEQTSQINQLDFELYRFADERLTRQISETGFAYKWDTLRLRARRRASRVKQTLQKRTQSATEEQS